MQKEYDREDIKNAIIKVLEDEAVFLSDWDHITYVPDNKFEKVADDVVTELEEDEMEEEGGEENGSQL